MRLFQGNSTRDLFPRFGPWQARTSCFWNSLLCWCVAKPNSRCEEEQSCLPCAHKLHRTLQRNMTSQPSELPLCGWPQSKSRWNIGKCHHKVLWEEANNVLSMFMFELQSHWPRTWNPHGTWNPPNCCRVVKYSWRQLSSCGHQRVLNTLAAIEIVPTFCAVSIKLRKFFLNIVNPRKWKSITLGVSSRNYSCSPNERVSETRKKPGPWLEHVYVEGFESTFYPCSQATIQTLFIFDCHCCTTRGHCDSNIHLPLFSSWSLGVRPPTTLLSARFCPHRPTKWCLKLFHYLITSFWSIRQLRTFQQMAKCQKQFLTRSFLFWLYKYGNGSWAPRRYSHVYVEV